MNERSAHSPASGARSGPIPSLDGLRAIAISLVFFAHGGLEHLVPGGFGVTLFFVLSGFLITTLMRTEYAKFGRLDLRAFYLRRLARLSPPLLIVVAVAAALSGLGLIGGHFSLSGLMSALFYFGNYHAIANDFVGLPAGLGVIWSLAVEEHFYLLFPPLAILLLRRNDRRTTAGTIGLLCGLILAWRIALTLSGASEDYIGMATDTRIDAILVGCGMALLRNPWLDAPLPTGRGREAAVALACLGVLLFSFVFREPWFRETLRYSLQSLAVAPLLYLAVARAETLPFRWLGSRALAYVGSVSYTVYLSHHLILLAIERHAPQLQWPAVALLGAAASLLAAEAMRRWVDVPVGRLRQRLRPTQAPPAPPRRPLASAPASVSVCIATYQRPARLDALLGDLSMQDCLPDEIVVIDNDADASGRDVATRWQDRLPCPLRYEVQPVKNISITRNRSVALAQGDWLAFIDDDERAPRDWLKRLIVCALEYSADGVLGPVVPLVPAQAPRWIRNGRFYDWARMPTGSRIPARQLRFGNLVLRAERLRPMAAPFDPAYGLTGGEDGDLLSRLQLDGAQLLWCDEAVVYEPVEAQRLSLRWLLRRSLRGGQDFARHTLAGRYGSNGLSARLRLFLQSLAQAAIAGGLCLLLLPLSRSRAALWAIRSLANIGKLSVFWGQHYREYA